MLIRTTTLALAAATATVLAATPATAQPAAAPNYHATIAGNSVVVTLDGATFSTATDGRAVLIHNADGATLATLPKNFTFDGLPGTLTSEITDHATTLTLTPDRAGLAAHPQLHSVASPLEDQLALNDLAGKLSTGPLVGGIVGTVVGALVGAVIGLGSCLVVGPACLATVPTAIAAFAGAGGVAGTLLAGGAVLADGLWKYLSTIQAPPGQSPYANEGGLLDREGAGVPNPKLRLPKLPSGSASGSSAE
ncbi:hypothetical protein ACL02S_01495 [Nocardia sp. 004]|uniref:hypothetical protein n=1 Tax=Nocardia sp. 004 TaxID=3385978 RepID=UPI0039A1B7A4